jgi:hypothetical protein
VRAPSVSPRDAGSAMPRLERPRDARSCQHNAFERPATTEPPIRIVHSGQEFNDTLQEGDD